MKQDGLVWLLCGLLFCAGVIWGGVPIGTDFFVVKDVHDLFEIFSSIATAAALFLAVAGISTWRKQFQATADHDLARRAAVTLSKYKSASRKSWGIASSIASNIKLDGPPGAHNCSDKYLARLELDSESFLTARAEMEAIAAECAAVWKDGSADFFREIIKFESLCSMIIRQYVSWAAGGYDDFTRIAVYNTLRLMAGALNSFGVNDHQAAELHINKLSENIENLINSKFIDRS